jgi:iron complex transport system permease protein
LEKSLNSILVVLLMLTFWFSLSIGSTDVDVWRGLSDWLWHHNTDAALIIGEIRLPRTLLSLLVGAGMAVSGAALQGLLRNPLVDPGLIGVSQGAAIAAAGVFYFGLFAFMGVYATVFAGLFGATLTLVLLIGLSGSITRPAVIIMAGLAISALSSALLALILNFAPSPYAMQELVFWLLGSVSHQGLDQVLVLIPLFVVGSVLIFSQRKLLAGLSLGEHVAESLGLQVSRGSRIIISATALLVGSSVAITGIIGFVGLLVPHLLRPLVSYRPDRLLLPAAMLGALVVCWADMLVRVLPPQRELKLGVITALVGAPFFIWLVWKERQRWL